MKFLITGCGGFVGRYLCEELESEEHEVVCMGYQESEASELEALDVTKLDEVRVIFDTERPDAVLHLAGLSRATHDTLSRALAVNVCGSVNVARAAQEVSAHGVVVNACYVYKPVPGALGEDAELAPSTLYGITRLAMEQAVRLTAAPEMLTLVRAFNHTGPVQSDDFLVPSLVQRALAVRAGDRSELEYWLGSPVRDVSDVRDIVRAYRLLAESRVCGTYNVGSGVGRSVREIVAIVCREVGIPESVSREKLLEAPAADSVLARRRGSPPSSLVAS
ncbi:MAG: NAD(P)-dependent oxidoreductase [Gemmatimonadota bacterium]|nr:NAD(P)-dependent oxidoreductase [Gemmatimonadota bacterium]MDE3006139.1 NAD(P)-dependent oxidoreductase [Gemmatimonadota bacterium]MDE3013669.1 NAD(P)-dependent oxidoreductase [Gemmatimonadota bacterium]